MRIDLTSLNRKDPIVMSVAIMPIADITMLEVFVYNCECCIYVG